MIKYNKEMRKERKQVKVSDLELNLGQVEWLPRNPRQWTKTDIDKTVASIREDEDFLEDRPLLVIMHGDKYIVFGGNLRTEASRKCGLKSVPAVVYTPESHEDRETVKRRAIKDNGSFGEWDFDKLANEWNAEDLNSWGVDVWQPEHAEVPQSGGASRPTSISPSTGGDDSASLPSELQGLDITPDELPKIEGSDEVAMDRVIITYPKDKEEILAALLGLASIDKVVYGLDELVS